MSAVLDTNILSELMRNLPDPVVERWIVDHPSTDLYFSSVGEAELRYGAATMPAGKRRDALARAIERILIESFSDRILPFDHPAAREYADTAAARKAAGRPILWADCQIAAIARSRSMAYPSPVSHKSAASSTSDSAIRPVLIVPPLHERESLFGK